MTKQIKMSDSELKKQCINAIFSAWFYDKDTGIKFLKKLAKHDDCEFVENHPLLLFILGHSIYNKRKLIFQALKYLLYSARVVGQQSVPEHPE